MRKNRHSLLNGLLVLLLVTGVEVAAQQTAFSKQYIPLKSGSVIADKNFYLFTLLKQLPGINGLLQGNAVLRAKLENARAVLSAARQVPAKEVAGVVPYFIWSTGSIDSIGKELVQTIAANHGTWALLIQHMRQSGFYILYDSLSNEALLQQAWQDAAMNENKLIQHYLSNKGFRYPAIDSASYAAGSNNYAAMLKETFLLLQHQEQQWTAFFEPSLQLALDILLLNNRDEAARFEPMDSTNQAAYKRIPSLNWAKYPYSVILVPGEGPENHYAISPMGKYRCQLGAEQYRKGMAPFIVVSGGYVHPFQTPYCEADEMKKYLVTQLGIPANAVIIEPHARHTTTNIRNVNRIILRKGMPAGKKVLCTSTSAQTAYIATTLGERCRKELGYIPFHGMQQVDLFNAAYYPETNSLQLDANDPLDP